MNGHYVDRITVLIAYTIALVLVVGSAYAALAACFGHPVIYGVTETMALAACLGFAGAALLRESLRMGFPS